MQMKMYSNLMKTLVMLYLSVMKCNAQNMREYGVSLTRILPYKDKIVDFVLIQENTGQ